jgi:RNA polymerase sigma factor (sigma-70 family)
VVLRYYAGLSHQEIATTLGVRPGTVKSMLHRALAQLREEIER